MAAPAVVAGIRNHDLVQNFLHLAQTSVYQVTLIPTGDVQAHIKRTKGLSWSDKTNDGSSLGTKVSMLCDAAQLPGSSFATHDVKSDFMGVTEKMAYRRMYGEQFTLSFYVDHDYKILHFFEGWMDFISGKGLTNRGTTDNYKKAQNGFRMSYPDQYKSTVEIVKFEKDQKKDNLNYYFYTMVDAFPISIDPIEINYGSSELMKLNVNFSMTRHTVEPISETALTREETKPKTSTKSTGLSGTAKGGTFTKGPDKPQFSTPFDKPGFKSPFEQTSTNTTLMSGFLPSSIGAGIA